MSNSPTLVRTGLDPVVHAELRRQKLSGSLAAAWIAGSSPAMTKERKKALLGSPPAIKGKRNAGKRCFTNHRTSGCGSRHG
jgi:hypothetical protein